MADAIAYDSIIDMNTSLYAATGAWKAFTQSIQNCVEVLNAFSMTIDTNVVEQLQSLVDKLNLTSSSFVMIDDAQQKNLLAFWDQYSLKIEDSIDRVEDLAKSYKDILGPELETLTEAADKTSSSLSNIGANAYNAVTGIGDFVEAVDHIGNAGKTFTNLATGISSLFTLILNHPIAFLIGAIISLVGFLTYLYNTNEWLRDGIQRLWDFLKDFWADLQRTFLAGLTGTQMQRYLPLGGQNYRPKPDNPGNWYTPPSFSDIQNSLKELQASSNSNAPIANTSQTYADNRTFQVRVDDLSVFRQMVGLVNDMEARRLRSRAFSGI